MDRIEIINSLIKEYKFVKYLEIGVRNKNDCFNYINCDIKHSIDPGYEYYNNEAEYKFTSDNFFLLLEQNMLDLDHEYKWDIIFIDGLHLATQVEKDILNSLNHLSDNGIILLHDCNPFLVENNYERVIEDYFNQSWNGTVWKAIYKLRTSRSDLKICTINEDEGIGIITRGYQKTIPLNNPYFEYRIFEKEIDTALNTINAEQLMDFLNT